MAGTAEKLFFFFGSIENAGNNAFFEDHGLSHLGLTIFSETKEGQSNTDHIALDQQVGFNLIVIDENAVSTIEIAQNIVVESLIVITVNLFDHSMAAAGQIIIDTQGVIIASTDVKWGSVNGDFHASNVVFVLNQGSHDSHPEDIRLRSVCHEGEISFDCVAKQEVAGLWDYPAMSLS